MLYKGGCKCGAVTFEVDGEIGEVVDCNCSVCRPKGYLHWFVPAAQVRMIRRPAELGEFTFNKHALRHRFCTACGVSPFVEGPGMVAVNARCLDGVDPEALTVKPFDGASL